MEGGQASTPTYVAGSPLARLRRWATDPLGYLEATRRSGDVVVSDFGFRQLWMLYRPEHIERVLVQNAANWTKDTRGYRAMRLVMGQGLITSQGDTWRRQRRIVNPAFHRRALAQMAGGMVELATEQADAWEAAAASGEPRDVARDMSELTLRIACRTFFSVDVHGRDTALVGDATSAVLGQFLFHLSFPFPWPELLPTPGNLRFWRAVRSLDDLVYRLVRDRRATRDRPHDLLSMLLEATDEDTGAGMSDGQLRDELVTLLIAGHETTANALAWTLHLLATHPSAAQRARDELATALGGRAPTAADVPALPYLKRLIDESLRLYPPAWVHARRAAADDDFGDFVIPAGSFALLPQWVVHRDPTLWPDPERYDPDRFLPERASGRHRFAWFPFGGGQRKCIGEDFAYLELVLALAVLLDRFELEPDPTRPVVPEPAVTLRPRRGLWMRVHRREGRTT